MSKTLMILFPEKAPDTKHICYPGGCPLHTKWVKEGQPSLCETLWNNPPKEKEGQFACMCNFYDTLHPVIVEADGVNIQEVIKRVEGKQEPQGLDEAAAKVDIPYEEINNTFEHHNMVEICKKLRSAAFKAGAKWMAEQGESITADVVEYNDGKMLSYDREFAQLVQKLNLGDKVIVQIRKK